METIKYQKEEYQKIIEDLKKGNVVGFPTDTVYGLAIIYNDEKAFEKLYEIKQRSINKPISMMVAKKENLKDVAIIDANASKIIDSLMPGALTIILKAKDGLPKHVTYNLPTIGIRIPTNKTALDILENIGVPLLVTSANLSGNPSLLKASDVYDTFKGKISSLIMEDSIGGVASTVVNLVGEIKVLRDGPIKIDKILEVIK